VDVQVWWSRLPCDRRRIGSSGRFHMLAMHLRTHIRPAIAPDEQRRALVGKCPSNSCADGAGAAHSALPALFDISSAVRVYWDWTAGHQARRERCFRD
jgi:hypothetical protein